MHGAAPGEDDRHCLRRHMWPAPPPPVAVSPDRSYLQPTAPDCFLKGGRKIQVGDCALFQAGNAPPFIGIIRWFVTSKEDFLKLCVNWLYRPADVKLAKGILVEAAPNEIFYSFHKDVISAASLLHPCKVAFLGKGIDLPSGISSFICRRVYDIESKCLWSLTDKDYINERQEEVDQLLDKTRLEMHATVQSGGRSPKSLNGPASQQLKSGSDVQNIGTSLPSQVKGKKRDRGDQVNEPIKRERSAKTEDDDSITSRLDSMIKAEITKITDKGGLTNSEGVDKLLHLMQFVRAERKLNLTGRVLLADVISATDRNDCLSRFVQLRGVAVLDDWLQEVRKGKTGDGSSPKESDKASEEFLLALLRALDKLPVSLNALQTCNIGKSVNNLRSHKNLEIQKKARGLVDTWKKRVDAEIKSNDAKSVGSSQAVSWPGKPGFSEVPQALNRRTSSTDVSLKSSIAQPSTCSRALPGKPDHADAIVKSAPVISGPLKMPSSSLPASMVGSKDSLLKGAGSSANLEVPQTAAKEEKSSSSSQSQNNSQSCSSDHAKTMGSSWKEDARSSSAGSINASKTSGGSSRHRRSNNGCPGASISVVQKEANLGKSGSPVRSTALDKVPQGSLTSEKPLDMPVSDRGSNHKLIVRIPNPGRNSMQSTGGGSLEDPSVIRSKGSSPSTLDNHENSDPRANMKGDQSHIATGVRTEAQQSNKEELAGLEERDRPPGATLDEGEGHKNADGIDKSTDVSRATFSSPGNVEGGCKTEQKPRNSFSPMNALIESCVKYSEASVSLSNGDDIGMNLLASVATGEMTKPDINSPKECPGTSPAIEEPRAGDSKAKSILSCDNGIAQSHGQCDETADVDSEKHDKCAGYAIAKDETQGEGTDFSADKKIITPVHENKSIVEQTGQQLISSINLHKVTDSSINSEGSVFSVCIPADVDEIECDGALRHHDKRKNCNQVSDPSDDKFKFRNSSTDGNKSVDCSTVCENIAESGTSASGFFCNSLDDGCQNDITLSSGKSEVAYCLSFNNEIPCGPTSIKQQLTPVSENDAENVDKKGDAGTSSCADESLCPDSADSKSRNSDCSRAGQSEHIDIERKEPSNCAPIIVEQVGSIINPLGTTGGVEEVVETKEVPQQPPVSSKCESAPTFQDQEVERCTKPTGSELSGADAAGRDELASSAEASSLVVDAATKLDFDLNEGITGDDENQSEPGTSAVLVCSSAVYLPCVSSFSCTPTSNGSPALVTMAAPAKGPFLPPENLSRNPELGWKGSAATSAFRPAEPRKILEMPLTTFEVPSSAAAKKHGRPLLDIDLNVADERALEDMASPSSGQTTGSESGAISNRNAPMRSSVGFDLDLNRVDKDAENGPFIANAIRRSDPSVLPVRLASGGLPTGDTNMFRDFDLNNGPVLEIGLESLPRRHHAKSNTSVPFLPPAAGLRMNNPDLGNLSPWFPPSNSYPAVAIPSFLPDRGEQNYPIVAAAGSQRIVGSVNGGANFGGDFYRGPVLSSSPAMAFAPATTFPYAGFTFGSSFPVASTSFSGVPTTYVDSSSGGGSSFPAVPSQLIGPGGAVSSQYPRPYVFGLPEASTSGGSDSSRKWARHGLDLNAGPGNAEAEVKDDIFSPASRQLSIASAQAFVEEQARSYQAAGSGLKRKEPEGGCDADRFVGYKQHPWQYADK